MTDASLTQAPAGTVRKRDGSYEPIDLNKIFYAITRECGGLDAVNPLRVAQATISGLYAGASTEELDNLSIHTAAALIGEEPQYSVLAARMLNTYIDKEVVRKQGLLTFSHAIAAGNDLGLISDELAEMIAADPDGFDMTIRPERSDAFGYFGLRTVYDRYLLRHPETRKVLETPQYFFLRVAAGLSQSLEEAKSLYDLMSTLRYLPSTPTLFNSGTRHPQMSSCYLLDSPNDSLQGIYKRYTDIASLSKFAGGIGVSWSRVRSSGSLIQGTNGHSNGVVPWLKVLDASVAAVNQGGKRRGAACVYLETWHADIEAFLELKDNTGDEARRTHNLNLANWVPDEFMRRVEQDEEWSLFDPKAVPELVDLWGEDFDNAYRAAESDGKAAKVVKARDLYSRMMRTLAQTGNGWMSFKDAANAKCNQTANPENVVHLSNLCTEIIEVTSTEKEGSEELAAQAVCNLGSVNLGSLVHGDGFDFVELSKVVRTAVRFLDRVIDINFYPTPEAGASNKKWRPVGLGVMGLQDVFFKLRLPFDSPAARELSQRISEEIYYSAVSASVELAEESGPFPYFGDTRAASGQFQFELWGVEPSDLDRWEELRARMMTSGMRNSLLIAIAPTATIASIAGAYECSEPQVSNLFKRETLSGEFLQVNTYLVADLKARGLWNEAIRNDLKAAEGSVQDIDEIPSDLKELYRTAWELPMRSLIDMAADRGAYIDQSQSLNLFIENPTIGKLSSMYAYAWKAGLKTTYYLRSRPATRIRQTTVEQAAPVVAPTKTYTDAEAVACSLENPAACEACE